MDRTTQEKQKKERRSCIIQLVIALGILIALIIWGIINPKVGEILLMIAFIILGGLVVAGTSGR